MNNIGETGRSLETRKTEHIRNVEQHENGSNIEKYAWNNNPRANGAKRRSGVSSERGLLIVHKRSSKSMFVGDGGDIFLVCHDVMLTLISTIWRTIMNS